MLFELAQPTNAGIVAEPAAVANERIVSDPDEVTIADVDTKPGSGVELIIDTPHVTFVLIVGEAYADVRIQQVVECSGKGNHAPA